MSKHETSWHVAAGVYLAALGFGLGVAFLLAVQNAKAEPAVPAGKGPWVMDARLVVGGLTAKAWTLDYATRGDCETSARLIQKRNRMVKPPKCRRVSDTPKGKELES